MVDVAVVDVEVVGVVVVDVVVVVGRVGSGVNSVTCCPLAIATYSLAVMIGAQVPSWHTSTQVPSVPVMSPFSAGAHGSHMVTGT